MKIIQYFDGHIIINLFGLILRIKHNKKYNCPEVIENGINTEEKRDKKIIISLTSFPERINIVTKTIKTLLTQTLKPDMVILWLTSAQFPNKEKDLPQELLNLKRYGLTIDWCNNIRSYKKIIPALKKYPDAIIITTDDDIYYAPDTVESLYKSYIEQPNIIHAHRCDWLTLSTSNKSETNEIITWAGTKDLFKDIHRGEASFYHRLSGYGAVLYPPHSLYKDVTDENIIKKIPTHDDIWLWAMAVLAGTKTKLVKGYSESINYIEKSQQYGLCKINKKGKGMSLSEAYNIILKEYPQILEVLKKECS